VIGELGGKLPVDMAVHLLMLDGSGKITAISRDHGRLPYDLAAFQGSAAPSPHDQDRPR
jgi:hypothetical protein